MTTKEYQILLSAPYMIPVIDRYRSLFEQAGVEVIVAQVVERLSEEDLMRYVGEIDGVICGDDQFTEQVLEAASPRLKVISKWGTGIDSIDNEAAVRLDIKICNTPAAFTDPVADTVMGYILAFARRGPWLDREMKAVRWEKLPGRSLNECTLGVVGVGNIGKAVLHRAQAFGMRLMGNDIVEIDQDFVARVGVEMTSLPELLSQADFVSLNCDLNPTSHHLINRETLGFMQSGAVLINTSRGQVVEEVALIEALQMGRLAGAALDVFEDEPLPPDSPLLGMDNVMLAPHNANSSPRAWEHVHWNTVRNLFLGLGLEPPEQG
jgi:D-3-phosphoglycerate dehydrogenase